MAENRSTIIIAEDEDDLIETYVIALNQGGFDVLKAKNGIEVLELLDKYFEDIKLLILDIVMPKMDGFEVLEKMKRDPRFQEIPVFMSTNLDNEEDKKEALEMGAKEYFIKSRHTPSQLAEEVEKFLKQDLFA